MSDQLSRDHEIALIQEALTRKDLDATAREGLLTALRILQASTRDGGVPVTQGAGTTTGPQLDGSVISGRDANIATIQFIINTFKLEQYDDLPFQIQRYLSTLVPLCRRLPLADIDDEHLRQPEIGLEDTFVPSMVASPVRDSDRSPFPTSDSTHDGLSSTAIAAISAYERLVIIGSPGSGKSTIANYLVLCLAQAGLGEPGALERLGPEWAHGYLLPIRIVVRTFAAWVQQHNAAHPAEELLWEYVRQQYSNLPQLVDFLRQQTFQGKTVLVCDGYDEVARSGVQAPLLTVRGVFDLLAAARLPRVVVTCRSLNYTERDRRLGGWPVRRLLPFTDELRTLFLDRWFAALERNDWLSGDVEGLKANLQIRLGVEPELQRLARNPLLLTIIAQLGAAQRRVPATRAALYGECVRLLLSRVHQHPDEPTLDQRLGLADWNEHDTFDLLGLVGYTLHQYEQHDPGTASPQNLITDNFRDRLIVTVASYFRRRDPEGDSDFVRAQVFFNHVRSFGTGLLQKDADAGYRFAYRSFQEYFAAQHLISSHWPDGLDGFVGRASTLANENHWYEVLLLAVSLLIERRQVRLALALANKLARPKRGKPSPGRAILAAELLIEIGRQRLQALDDEGDELWVCVADILASMLEPEDTRRTMSAIDSVRAARVLGRLEDPRPGVITLTPAWQLVPAGPFIFGSGDSDSFADADERPQRSIELPAFRIARYPVTNAQWRNFIKAGGYTQEQWWDASGWAARQYEQWSQPRFWELPRFDLPNQPVVGISWYEARAYCCWLSEQLGYDVRLPTEEEWEKAARGTDGRIYPWGDTWNQDWVNTRERGPGIPTPVGCFAQSTSPYGILDLSGNVLEWTASPWAGAVLTDDGSVAEMSDSPGYVWRGGSWAGDRRTARCACRGWLSPTERDNDLGLRVCTSVVLDDGKADADR